MPARSETRSSGIPNADGNGVGWQSSSMNFPIPPEKTDRIEFILRSDGSLHYSNKDRLMGGSVSSVDKARVLFQKKKRSNRRLELASVVLATIIGVPASLAIIDWMSSENVDQYIRETGAVVLLWSGAVASSISSLVTGDRVSGYSNLSRALDQRFPPQAPKQV